MNAGRSGEVGDLRAALDQALESAAGGEDLGFDPQALKAKYRTERDKRLRGDGNGQWSNGSRALHTPAFYRQVTTRRSASAIRP